MYRDSVKAAGGDPRYAGVIPPASSPIFMTDELLPYQKAALSNTQFGRMWQVYPGNRVHDVNAAIKFLRNEIVGFFVTAPLDWGMGAKIGGALDKHKSVDIAKLEVPASETKEV